LEHSDETKRKAVELLLDLAKERRGAMDNDALALAFSDDLVLEVFELAWAHQWERNTEDFRRETRTVVGTAVERTVTSLED